MTIAEALIADFEEEAKKSRTLLEAVPADKYGWKPHDKSMSLGQLASHIAETPSWHHSMLEDIFDFDAMMADYKPFAAADPAELLATFDANASEFTAAIEGKDDAFMTGTWKGLSGGEEIMGGPRHSVLRSILIHHVIHHRGQLTVYLRLLDVPVPPTFGPTADQQAFG